MAARKTPSWVLPTAVAAASFAIGYGVFSYYTLELNAKNAELVRAMAAKDAAMARAMAAKDAAMARALAAKDADMARALAAKDAELAGAREEIRQELISVTASELASMSESDRQYHNSLCTLYLTAAPSALPLHPKFLRRRQRGGGAE